MSSGGRGVVLQLGSEDALRYEIGTLRKEILRLQGVCKHDKAKLTSLMQEITNLNTKLNARDQAPGPSMDSAASDKIAELKIINRQLTTELSKKKEQLKDSELLITRLRATKELMSAELAVDDNKIKSMVAALNLLEAQIEEKGKTEREKSHLYEQLKGAFIEKCRKDRGNTTRIKTSGSATEKKLSSMLDKFKRDLKTPDGEAEGILIDRARDRVVHMVKKSQDIISSIGRDIPGSSVEDAEEEICIKIKRRRTSQPDKYFFSSISHSMAPENNKHQQPEVNLDTADYSKSIDDILSAFRSSSENGN